MISVDAAYQAFGDLHRKASEERRAASSLRTWTPQPGPQTLVYNADHVEQVLYGGAAGGGKALALDTPIPTPDGWTAMGDLRPGDVVLDDVGRPCTVVHAFDVLHDRPCFEVVFSDGTVIVADGEHRWVTTTLHARAQALRTTAAFRDARRDARPGRGLGKRPDLAARNAARAAARRAALPALDEPLTAVRTTAAILASLRVNGRVNHAVAVAGALELPERALPIDPYVLGVWLGDGTAATGSITTADEEVLEQLRSAGFEPRKQRGRYAFGVLGLRRPLRLAGLLGNKHVPPAYLRASRAQRLALLQGLMDTDGNIAGGGQCEFTTTSPALRDGVEELLATLGIKAVATEGVAKIQGRAVGPKWRFKFLTDLPAFRLSRKLNRQKREGFRGTHDRRYVVDVRPVPSVPVRCISVDSPSHCYLAGRAMVPTHNSDLLVALPARWAKKPGFNAIIFRRETPQLDNLLAKAREIYKYGRPGKIAPALPTAKENLNDHRWRVPDGGQIRFWHCQREGDARSHDGDEFQFVGFDELTHFLESQFDNLCMRIRGSTPGLPRMMRATTNPGGPGAEWVKRRWGPWLDRKFFCPDWEEPWVDADGVEHVTRGKGLPPRFDDRGNPLPPAAPGQVLYVTMFGSVERFSVEPFDAMGAPAISRTFVPAKLSDNPALLREDPGYLARIRASKDPVRRKQLEEGDWDVSYAAGEVFKRTWFDIVDEVPPGQVVRCRAWDLAATEVSTSNADPDWTRGVKLVKHENGLYYVEHLTSRRAHPGVVEQLVKTTAKEDGRNVRVRLPIDPAQAGKSQASNFVRLLEGYRVHTVQTSGRGDKLTRAGIVAAQVSPQSTGGTFGRFRIVRGAWNAEFLDELEGFPEGHDDIVDAFADAHDELVNVVFDVPQGGSVETFDHEVAPFGALG